MIQRLDEWIREIAEASLRLSELGALEGAAGNISLFLPAMSTDMTHQARSIFTEQSRFDQVAHGVLPEGVLIVSGTGRRLRDIAERPGDVLCAIVIGADGQAVLHRAPGSGVEPTSEIDSHVGIHAACLADSPAAHTVIHAQPPKLTWLSHQPAYRSVERLNRQLLRWQPETIVTLPEGIGVLPFEVPGTPEHGAGTAWAMRQHRVVVWAKHGVVARSPRGPLAAADLIDYVEAAASYEANDVLAGRLADGLSLDELRAIANRFRVSTSLLDRLPDDLLER